MSECNCEKISRDLVDYFIEETNKKYEKIDERLLHLEKLASKLIGISIGCSIFISAIFQTFLYYLKGIK